MDSELQEIAEKAERFADLWIKHVRQPDGLGPQCVAMVNARADLVRMFHPDYDGRAPERKRKGLRRWPAGAAKENRRRPKKRDT